MTGDFNLSNCVVCNCPNLNLHTNSSLINEERNLFKILCNSLDPPVNCKNRKNSSGLGSSSSSSLFCSGCKVELFTLNLVQEQIHSLEEKKTKLISKLISSIILSSSYQSVVIKKETDSTSNDGDNEEAQSLRKQIIKRFCPIVSLRNSQLDQQSSLNLNSCKIVTQDNRLTIDEEENYISNNFEDDGPIDDEIIYEREENTLEFGSSLSPAQSKEIESDGDGDADSNSDSETGSGSDSDYNPRSSSSQGPRQGIKRRNNVSINSDSNSKSTFSNGDSKNSKKSKFALFQPVVEDLGDGKFMYRDVLPFESVPGTSGFKCGSCHRMAKNMRSMRHHLHLHHYEPNEKGNNNQTKSVVQNPNPRVGVWHLSTLELGPGRFITNGQWIFSEVQPQPLSIQFGEDGQEQEQKEEGQQVENSAPASASSEISYQCETCKKILVHKKRMITHIREAHYLPNYVCDLCGREFNNKRNFENHSITHSDLKSFQCDICGTKYKQKAYLVLHLKSHADAFRCTFEGCDRYFKSRQGLVSHTEQKHSEAEESQSQCTHCGKLVGRKQLRKHIERVHEQIKNFFCNVCEKGFYEKRKWKDHVQRQSCNVNDRDQEQNNTKVKSNRNRSKPKKKKKTKNNIIETKEAVQTEYNSNQMDEDEPVVNTKRETDSLSLMEIGEYYKQIMQD